MAIPEYPITRREQYLDAIATNDTSVLPAEPITRTEQYLDAIARNGGGGGSTGGGVPAVTADDIGKSLMVQEVKHYTSIVPAQTITIPAYDPEDPQDYVMIELQAENTDLFVDDVILRVTEIQNGETFQENHLTDIEEGYVWELNFCKDIATNKVYYFGTPDDEPLELTVSLDKETTSTAEWGKQFSILPIHVNKVDDIFYMDRTVNEIHDAMVSGRLPVNLGVPDPNEEDFYCSPINRLYFSGGKWNVAMLGDNTIFTAANLDDYPSWEP